MTHHVVDTEVNNSIDGKDDGGVKMICSCEIFDISWLFLSFFVSLPNRLLYIVPAGSTRS